ncbi:MAG: Ig-like domain-containing protein [Tannerellaceae bacterium]|nr:Ig-like domain-containing protein [Tannerellaceae bacterium]
MEDFSQRVDETGKAGTIAQVVLKNDIVCNEGGINIVNWSKKWKPIPLNGIQFLGEGHTISGLFVEESSEVVGVGLFSEVIGNALIKDLGIVRSYIKGGTYTGAIAGGVSGTAQIRNCFVNTTIITTDWYAGGVAGRCYGSGRIVCSYSAAAVISEANKAGGVAGSISDQARIEKCFWMKSGSENLPSMVYGVSSGSASAVECAGKSFDEMHDYGVMWALNKAKIEFDRLWIRPDGGYPSLSDTNKVLVNKVILDLDIPESVLYMGVPIEKSGLVIQTTETGPLNTNDYSVSYQDNTEAGQAGLYVELKPSNYLEGRGQIRRFVIEKLSDEAFLRKVNIPYDGKPKTFSDFTAKAKDSIPARFGEVQIVPLGANNVVTNVGNYSATVKVSGWGWSKNMEFHYAIEKGTLPKDAFVYTMPSGTIFFDGTPKTVSVHYQDGIEGAGAFVVKYNGEENAPTAAGRYVVSVDYVEGTSYKAGRWELGSFDIVKTTLPSSFKEDALNYELPSGGIAFFNGLPHAVPVSFKPSVVAGFDGVTLNVTYYYASDKLTAPPVEIGGPYLVFVTVPETKNHRETTIQLGSFVIERGRHDASLLQDFIPKGQRLICDYDGAPKGAFSLRKNNLPPGIGTMTAFFVNKASKDTLYEAPRVVGVYKIFASFSEGEKYDRGIVEGGEIEIQKVKTSRGMFGIIEPVVVSFEDEKDIEPVIVPFDGKPQRIRVKLREGLPEGVGDVIVKYDGSETLPSECGKYLVTISVEEGVCYEAKLNLGLFEFQIVQIDQTSLHKWLNCDLTDREYTGKVQEIGVRWADGMDISKMGKITDTLYNGTSEVPLEVGSYKVSVKVAGAIAHAAGEIELGSFAIRPVDLSIEENRVRFLTYPTSAAFTGEPQEVRVSLKEGLKGLGSPVTITYENNMVPQNIGNYVVYVSIPAGKNFLAAQFQIAFSITPMQGVLEFLQNDVIYTGKQIDKPTIQSTTLTAQAQTKVKFEYKLSGQADQIYVEAPPENAGTYIVRATGPAEGDYSGIVTERTFKILKAEGVLVIALERNPVILGEDPVVQLVSTTNVGAVSVTRYKEVNEVAWTDNPPRKPGHYIVSVTYLETQNYNVAISELPFIVRGPAQDITYTLPPSVPAGEYPLGVGTIKINAVSSEHTLSYSSNAENVATVDATGLVTVHRTGKVTITISQNGNPLYDPADSVFVVLTIKGADAITDVFDASDRIYLSSDYLAPGSLIYLEADLDESLLVGAEVAVCDFSGKMIERKKATGRTTALHTPTKSGVYLYAFINAGKGFRRTIKVVVR